MPNFVTQAELYRKGWSTLRCLKLGAPDCTLVDGAAFPATQYPALRAQHGAQAQRAWKADKVQADEIRRQVLRSVPL